TTSSSPVAWLAGGRKLIAMGGEAYNLAVDIDYPAKHSKQDSAIIVAVDDFLRDHDAYPIATVANTIFPQDLYRRHGRTGLYSEYLKSFEAIQRPGWGRYFERMIRWPADAGN